MNTPICDFTEKYNKIEAIRLHMPGHKGKKTLGFEESDITEIPGADSLYEANGIIRESERNAGLLFGCETFYSTEGSSLCIRAMVYLFRLWAGENGLIIASRNAHKAFISAVALLDIDVQWVYPKEGESYLSCGIDGKELDTILSGNPNRKIGVYITSPDYLGNIADIKGISKICKKHGAKLLVDNAHGAYLRFLPESRHPIDLGADICCDSAHKTLPVLTGGAYLHIGRHENLFSERAKDALSLFASTSPSYLILQSLDRANRYISEGYSDVLADYSAKICQAVDRIRKIGYDVKADEPLKITVLPKSYGYHGQELAAILEENGIIAEFSDKDHTVLMLTPENGTEALEKLVSVLEDIPKKNKITDAPPRAVISEKRLSPRRAMFAESEIIDAADGAGRIFAGFNIACPPAVSIIICGEEIGKEALNAFKYYGIETIRVVKEK